MNRQQIIEDLLSHTDYGGWNHPMRHHSPIAWNVKMYFDIDWTGKCKSCPEYKEPIEERFDEKWKKEVEKNHELFYYLQERMAEQAGVDGDIWHSKNPFFEYSTYPGDDQGDWKFCFGGRSGGWLILAGWRHHDIIRKIESRGEFEEWLEELDDEDLKTFHRGVGEMDKDFSKNALQKLADSCVNMLRIDWEERQLQDERDWQAIHMYA